MPVESVEALERETFYPKRVQSRDPVLAVGGFPLVVSPGARLAVELPPEHDASAQAPRATRRNATYIGFSIRQP